MYENYHCDVSYNGYLLMCRDMARGRNDRAIINALELAMDQVLQTQQNLKHGAIDEFRGTRKFQRINLPTFKGRYYPEGAQTWLRWIDKIFRVRLALTTIRCCLILISEETED